MRLLCCLLMLLAAGCNRGPAMGTVSGSVTWNGQPVDGGLIRFVPADGNSQPEDCIVTGGKYSLTTPVGEKRVEVYWTKDSGSGKVDTASQGSEAVVVLIPPKFNSETTLSYTVEKGQQAKDWELSGK